MKSIHEHRFILYMKEATKDEGFKEWQTSCPFSTVPHWAGPRVETSQLPPIELQLCFMRKGTIVRVPVYLRVLEDELCICPKDLLIASDKRSSCDSKHVPGLQGHSLSSALGTQSVYWDFTSRTVDIRSPAVAFIIVCCLLTGEAFKSTRIWSGCKNQEIKKNSVKQSKESCKVKYINF